MGALTQAELLVRGFLSHHSQMRLAQVGWGQRLRKSIGVYVTILDRLRKGGLCSLTLAQFLIYSSVHPFNQYKRLLGTRLRVKKWIGQVPSFMSNGTGNGMLMTIDVH